MSERPPRSGTPRQPASARPTGRESERRPAPDSPVPGTYVVSMSELERDVCWRLVAKAQFGRVGFVRDAEPWVLPVNCVVAGEGIVFRTVRGSMLDTVPRQAVVTFEADGTDRVAESGWSVLVRGRLHEVTAADEIASLAEAGLEPWAPGVRDRWLRIDPFEVSGRIVTRSFRADHGDGLPPTAPA